MAMAADSMVAVVTIVAGPMVNVVICLVCGLGLYMTVGVWPLGPFSFGRVMTYHLIPVGFSPPRIFSGSIPSAISAALQLLPVFPLDGGQLLQAICGSRWATTIDASDRQHWPGGSVLMAMVALATLVR